MKLHTLSRIVSVSCVFLFCGTLLVACDDSAPKRPEVRPVKVKEVGKPQRIVIRSFPGKVLATDQARLAFEVPGQLIKFPIKEGQKIKKGQLIGELDQTKYQEKVNETKARLIRTRAEYQRARRLVKDDFISRTEFDRKRSAYLVAEANYNTAKKDLNDCTLSAPFDGVIAKKFVKNFEKVKAKQDIVLFQDLDQLDIEVNVPEYIILNLKAEKKAVDEETKVSFEGAPKQRFKVKVKEFSTQADPETQTYRVLFTLPAPKTLNVFPGMTATVWAPLPDLRHHGEQFILLPGSAVFDGPDQKSSVWVVDTKTKTVKRRVVKISRLQNGSIRVLSGLKPGETVVVAGVHNLQENQKVKIAEPVPEAKTS